MTYVLTPPIFFTFPHPTFPTGAPAQGWSLRGGICSGLGWPVQVSRTSCLVLCCSEYLCRTSNAMWSYHRLSDKTPKPFKINVFPTSYSKLWKSPNSFTFSRVYSPFMESRFSSPFMSCIKGFPCGLAGKESARNEGDLGLIPGLGRSPGEGKGYPLQYSGLENSMDCIVFGVTRVEHDWVTFTFFLSILDKPHNY